MQGKRFELSNGAALTFRVLGKGMRDRLALETAEDEAALAENRGRSLGPYSATAGLLQALQECRMAGREDEAREIEARLCALPESAQLVELQAEAEPILWRTYRALLRAALVRVEGIGRDGSPVSVEEFINGDPDEMLSLAVRIAMRSDVQGGN